MDELKFELAALRDQVAQQAEALREAREIIEFYRDAYVYDGGNQDNAVNNWARAEAFLSAYPNAGAAETGDGEKGAAS